MKPHVYCKHPSHSLPGGSVLKLQLYLESEKQRVCCVTDSSLQLWQFPDREINVSVRGAGTSQTQSYWQVAEATTVSQWVSSSVAPGRSIKHATTSKSYFTSLGKTLTTDATFTRGETLPTLPCFCSSTLSPRGSLVWWKRKRVVNLSSTLPPEP